MHINTVEVNGIWVSYDLEGVDEEIQIVANFTKNGERIYKIYNISELSAHGPKMVVELLNSEFAKRKAQRMIDDLNKSKHSPFKIHN